MTENQPFVKNIANALMWLIFLVRTDGQRSANFSLPLLERFGKLKFALLCLSAKC